MSQTVTVDAATLFSVLNWTGVPPDRWNEDARQAWRALMACLPDSDRRLIAEPRAWRDSR
ncbi:hypothetical protein [Luteipulveratus mongoliensis]|nr:hypothetical protein [Luteipulveratus mongoliensis]